MGLGGRSLLIPNFLCVSLSYTNMASSSTGGDYHLGWPLATDTPAPTLNPSAPPSNTSESTNPTTTPAPAQHSVISDSSNKQPTLEDLPGEGAEAEEDEDKRNESIYECTICLETAKDAVVSLCGHLFCWPCLHQWLETRPTRQLCPVCKAAISKDKVIPLYGRDSKNQQDPRWVLWLTFIWRPEINSILFISDAAGVKFHHVLWHSAWSQRPRWDSRVSGCPSSAFKCRSASERFRSDSFRRRSISVVKFVNHVSIQLTIVFV